MQGQSGEDFLLPTLYPNDTDEPVDPNRGVDRDGDGIPDYYRPLPGLPEPFDPDNPPQERPPPGLRGPGEDGIWNTEDDEWDSPNPEWVWDPACDCWVHRPRVVNPTPDGGKPGRINPSAPRPTWRPPGEWVDDEEWREDGDDLWDDDGNPILPDPGFGGDIPFDPTTPQRWREDPDNPGRDWTPGDTDEVPGDIDGDGDVDILAPRWTDSIDQVADDLWDLWQRWMNQPDDPYGQTEGPGGPGKIQPGIMPFDSNAATGRNRGSMKPGGSTSFTPQFKFDPRTKNLASRPQQRQGQRREGPGHTWNLPYWRDPMGFSDGPGPRGPVKPGGRWVAQPPKKPVPTANPHPWPDDWGHDYRNRR